MKFTALISALILGASCAKGPADDQGYSVGGISTISLPTNLGGRSSSSSSSSSTSFSSSSVQVPSFPAVNNLGLAGWSATGGASGAGGIGGLGGDWATQTINNAKAQIATSVRSVESLFTRFPSIEELVGFVDNGDVAGITQTLQTVSLDDSVPCGVKVSYLLNLLNYVKDGARRKSLVADQLETIIAGAKAEIARLTDEINRAQKERDGLGLPAFDSTTNSLSVRLNDLNQKIRTVGAQITPEQARVANFQRELEAVNGVIDSERNNVNAGRVRLAATDATIRDLEAKILQARDRRSAIQGGITTSENLIRQNQRKIDNIRSTIADIVAKIRGLKDTVDNLKRQSNTLQIDLQRARTTLNDARTKDRRLNDTINRLRARLADQQQKAPSDMLVRLRTIVDNLNNNIPNINNDINREYYYCYGAGKVDTQSTGSVIVYVVKGEAFGQYLQNAYGQSVGAPRLTTGSDYRLQIVDPYSQVWTAKYGYPTLAENGGTGFSCISEGSMQTGSGRITSINSDSIVVSGNDGRSVSLAVGGCSRIQSTSSVPSVGQNLFWRGVPSSNGYNLHAATCW